MVKLVQDRSVDEVGLNVGAIHALWTLSGLGLVDASQPEVITAVYEALEHPAPGVRRNAVQYCLQHLNQLPSFWPHQSCLTSILKLVWLLC